VFLKAGEEKNITIKLSPESLKFYDICSKSWIAEPGKFKVHVGTSSRDIKLVGEFELE
jgi:beta-glucosidase